MIKKNRYLFFTVFISGMVSLAVELSASRLLGNVFGTSNLVWASIIGLILIYLTIGYFLGGWWADHSPHFKTLYTILIWAGFTVGLVPVISKPILRLSAQAFDHLQIGVLAGSFIAVLILLVIPVTLLGTASPFAIRLAIQDSREAGRISGWIYAISTLGSFVGTFLPVLLLIPTIGTFRTFLAFSGMLVLVAMTGLALTAGIRGILWYVWMPIVLLMFTIWGVGGAYKTTPGLVYETESAYNYIQVLEQNGYFLLRLNDGQGIHSVYNPKVDDYYGPWEQVLVAPYFNAAPFSPHKVRSIAIVGLAAGTTVRGATQVYGAIPIDGYEIDPVIIDVGRKYFNMTEPNLNAIAVDGRWGLEHSQRQYDIISVDAYRPPYIPFHLTTREFFEIVRQRLTPDGVMVINVGRSPEDRRLVNALASTILTVFPTIHSIDVPNSFNTIIFATLKPTQDSNLALNLAYLEKQGNQPTLLMDTLKIAVASLQPLPPPGLVFTDDLAPVEWITNRMVLDFVLSPEIKKLQ